MAKESDLRKLADEARSALEHEQEFFTPRLKSSGWSAPKEGEIEAWSQGLQVIESAGWTLVHWSTATDAGGVPSAYPVFRRRRTPGVDPTTYEGGRRPPP